MEIIDRYQTMTPDNVGGKFYSQARLKAEGLPVPGFFCLSASLFDRLVQPLRHRIEIHLAGVDLNDRNHLQKAARHIAALISEIRFDPATEAAILARFDERFGPNPTVSVRASMVAKRREFSEDSADNPFAGISDSYLYVSRSQLLTRIRDCWASAFGEKALVYRLSQGIDLLDVSVAVGIQRMVDGERSFVMFTCDPTSLARDTVIVAGYGIGEGVVQETVPVDHYFIGCKTAQVRQVLADKHSQLVRDQTPGELTKRRSPRNCAKRPVCRSRRYTSSPTTAAESRRCSGCRKI
ncbi:hypothetical protein CAI21_04110 [Alkalilimnicola ehrlichii]|uniref:Phosphoenolpyruvate synthase n=1 Tax=Alkalilimnicola ehrlichii TaxID=351052 RepID=A0A3E0WZ23_9GAMM|nr:PEP/pyruvate-binding domain-containing protein [Alkalilimnicola ehrlichii]RFA30703.1 hypothetical protein CAI21_04110 [Alkalilimnicola ehrlichii]RFA38280.1 hypothetical protein CAL65_05475 [Alkalilimnicola ehrlichii]